MQINTGKDVREVAQKRKIELEIMLLSSDMKKAERMVATLQTENRSLENQKKRILLESDRNRSLLRTQEANLERIKAEIGIQKKRLNSIR